MPGPSADHGAQGGVEAESLGVVEVLVASQAAVIDCPPGAGRRDNPARVG
jgi:hypothetical protein